MKLDDEGKVQWVDRLVRLFKTKFDFWLFED